MLLIIKSVVQYDPKQTVMDQTYRNFRQEEHPCLVLAFWNREKTEYAKEVPRNIYVANYNSGSQSEGKSHNSLFPHREKILIVMMKSISRKHPFHFSLILSTLVMVKV